MPTDVYSTCMHQCTKVRERCGWRYLDVDVLLGGGLEELESELVGQLFAALVADDALVLHVALVTHQDHLRVIPRVRLDLGAPAGRAGQTQCVVSWQS